MVILFFLDDKGSQFSPYIGRSVPVLPSFPSNILDVCLCRCPYLAAKVDIASESLQGHALRVSWKISTLQVVFTMKTLSDGSQHLFVAPKYVTSPSSHQNCREIKTFRLWQICVPTSCIAGQSMKAT